MSSIFLDKNILLSFDQWCLSESIVDTPTKFGTNAEMDNGETKTELGVHHTFFKHKGLHHCVYLSNYGEVGMGTSQDPSTDISSYSDKRQPHGGPIGAFGKSMHVIHHLVDKHGINKIHFTGADPRLGTMYDRLMDNKHFQKSMRDKGWNHKTETISKKNKFSNRVNHYNIYHFERK